MLLLYMNYHNEVRTHLSLEKDAPVSRTVELAGRILLEMLAPARRGHGARDDPGQRRGLPALA